jgi:uncharacterized protein
MATETTPSAPVGWFEIGTDDPVRAREFYADMFGWSYSESDQGPYTFVTTGPDHPLPGGIQDTSIALPEGTPRSYAVFYVLVPDVAATCGRVEELGGKVLVPATTIPSGLVYAHVTDPAGNHFGLFCPPGS